MQCAHGDAVTYSLARVERDLKGRALTVKEAGSDTMQQSELLGTDVPDLSGLLKPERYERLLW